MTILRIIGCFLICFSPVFVNSILKISPATDWYQNIVKPEFIPPSWVFGVVWVMLYSLLAVSLYMFLSSSKPFVQKRFGLVFFFLQLVLNSLYSPVFFGQNSIEGGLVISVALLVSLIFMTLEFYKVSIISAYLLIPYLLWGSYAVALGFSIFRLN